MYVTFNFHLLCLYCLLFCLLHTELIVTILIIAQTEASAVLRKYGRKVHVDENLPFEPQVCGDQTP